VGRAADAQSGNQDFSCALHHDSNDGVMRRTFKFENSNIKKREEKFFK
jgi:hypothetical protein